MLKDALNARQARAAIPGSRRKVNGGEPWFIQAEKLCQVMIYQGSTQAIAQPANVAERVAIEKAKSILGIK